MRTAQFKISATGPNPSLQCVCENVDIFRRSFPHGAFPDNSGPPAKVMQCLKRSGVSRTVARNLFVPDYCIAARKAEEGTVVPMPKTSINENRYAPSRECHVRSAGKLTVVQSISESALVKCASDYQLNLCILSSYSRHHPAADGRVNCVQSSD